MRHFRLALLLTGAVSCAACFNMTTILKVDGNGSGTITHTMLLTTQAIAQLRQLAALGGGRGSTFDPLSEAQARTMASVIGEGVTFVSSSPITTPAGQGRESVYAFTDINKLKVSTQPPAPAGVNVQANGISTEGETVTFSLTHESNGNAVLHINVPEPNWLDSIGSREGANGSSASPAAGQLAMIKSLLAGAHVLLAVEPTGTLVRSSSPYVDGPRVTLLEVDLDQMFKDDTLAQRLRGAKTQEDMKAIIKETAGLKINFDREITIEFAATAR
jgi:hypothetical protein